MSEQGNESTVETSISEVLQNEDLERMFQLANSKDEWEQFFYRAEMFSPFVASAAECPNFVVTPPILESKDLWDSIRDPSIDRDTWSRLTKSNFMPMDRALLERRSFSDVVAVSHTAATHPLVDLDYGLVLTPGGRFTNFTLDHAHLMRVQRLDKFYVQHPSAIFSVGAYRARDMLDLPSKEPWIVPEFEICNRAELDSMIGKVRERLGKYPKAELWFRGQTSDYLLDGTSRRETLCPWRATQDSSLVPSLYRGTWHGGNLRSYAEKLVRVQKYVTFAGQHLRVRPFTERAPGEAPVEKLPDGWDSYAPAFTSHQTDAGGNYVSSRDYHHAFDGLQRSFFLQHYGLPSNILDITKDIDTGLFFAQNTVDKDMRVAEAQDGEAVLYVFVLLPEVDRFLDSTTLSEHFGLLRPMRQQCGLLCGASFVNRNHYARYIALKFRLRKRLPYQAHLTADYVYPSRKEDSFLDSLLGFAERNESDLGTVLPFAPQLAAGSQHSSGV